LGEVFWTNSSPICSMQCLSVELFKKDA
jgi:hypothetical protein